MKQLILDFSKGESLIEDIPIPTVKEGQVLIQTTRSLVSIGTERMLVEFGKANFIQKALQQPEKVKEVFNKVKTDGLSNTINAVFNKLGQPIPLGYCNVGKVIEVGKGVKGLKVGDRVTSNGNHAEYVTVPENLVAKIPNEVTDDEASFTVIGAIGLQGIRLINPTFGETIVVVGLGLIGLITIQLLKANGCNVIGFDFDSKKVELAKEFGVDAINLTEGTNSVAYVMHRTNDIGADGVVITATSKSNEIISQAAKMSRKKGRIVLVGVIGLEINRTDFFEKELSFQVSCSYGPGRYDENYEHQGNDYPIGYVRWTEKRNFEAVLNALALKSVKVDTLITERTKLQDYKEIYGDISNGNSIASIIEYSPKADSFSRNITINTNEFNGSKGVVGIIGAGNFTSSMILPCLKKSYVKLKYIASLGGLTGTILAKKFGIAQSTSDYQNILKDEEVDLVMIATRHNLHANMVVEVLKAKKHVFVEKPLALNQEELDLILEEYKKGDTTVNVGFNRRFAPFAIKMKKLLGNSNSPMNIVATMNAGFIPANVWVHDMKEGGGRIIGEASHFIDLCTYLSGSKVKAVCMNAMGVNPEENTDNATILLKYENGTNAVINYFANGSKSYSKEKVEVYHQQRTLVMDNWRKLKGYGFKGDSSASSGQDKGHANQFNLLVDTVINGGNPIVPMDEIVNTTKASFAAIESLKTGAWVEL